MNTSYFNIKVPDILSIYNYWIPKPIIIIIIVIIIIISLLSFRDRRKKFSPHLHILHSFGWSVIWYWLAPNVAVSQNFKLLAANMGYTQFLSPHFNPIIREFIRPWPVSVKNTTRFALHASLLNLSCCWTCVTSLPFESVTNMTYDILPLHQWNMHSTFAWLIDKSMCAVTFMDRNLCARFIPSTTQISISSVTSACNFPRLCRFMSVQYVSGSLILFPSQIAFTTVSVVPAHLCCPVNWEIVGEAKADFVRYDTFSAKTINPSHASVNEVILKKSVGFCCVQSDINAESTSGLKQHADGSSRILNFLSKYH